MVESSLALHVLVHMFVSLAVDVSLCANIPRYYDTIILYRNHS